MSAGSMIIAKQNQAMRKFREAGAISPECAETLDDLKLSKSRVFKVLLAQGVFQETPEHSYWINLRSAKTFVARRRNRLMLLLLIVAVSFGISYL
ncbi:MAG: hypothetical protein ACI8TQ_001146 [Planctomycetota bacterium]|jgi:hypothetical protein